MDIKKYNDFFYYTDKGYSSFFRDELLQCFTLEWKVKLHKVQKIISQEMYLEVAKSFLNEVLNILKIHKIKKDRRQSFIYALTKEILKGCPSQGRGLQKGFFDNVNKFIDLDDIFNKFPDYTKDWRENIESQFEFKFKKIKKVAVTNKMAMYLKILGFGVNEVITKASVKKRYTQLVKTKHPDVGGNRDEFIAITDAKDYLLENLNE